MEWLYLKNNKRMLDDQAKIFSLSYNKNDISVFRLSVKLKDYVDSAILNKTLNIIIDKYKLFKVKLKKGYGII